MPPTMARGRLDVYTQRQARQRQEPVIIGRLQSGRPIVQNPDGTYSTHQNIITNLDGLEYVIPTLLRGRQLSEQQAIEAVVKAGMRDPETGEPLQGFPSVEEAQQYEDAQHEQLEDELETLTRQKAR